MELPYVVKDVTLFVPGVHNGVHFTRDEIQKAYSTTNWNDKRIRALYIDHRDDWAVDPSRPYAGKSKQVGACVRDYAGSVRNIKLSKQNTIVGDLYIVDRGVAEKLSFEDVQFAISPSGHWMKGNKYTAKDFVFHNFAIVVNPAQKQTYIHNTAMSQIGQLKYYNFAMSANEDTKMDFDELKDDLGAIVESKVSGISEKVTSLSEDVESMKKEKEEEKKRMKEAEEAMAESESKKEKEALESKVKELEEKLAQKEEPTPKEDPKDEEEDKPEEDMSQDVGKELEKDTPKPKTETPPQDTPPVEMSRTKANKGFAEWISGIGAGV